MTAGTHYSRFQQGIIRGFYEYRDGAMVQRLAEIVSDLAVESDRGKLNALWKNAGLTLAKTSADPMKSARIIADRNLEGLGRLVEELTAKAAAGPAKPGPAAGGAPVTGSQPAGASAAAAATAAASQTPPAPALPTGGPPGHAELKSALKAFKKRLKVTRLDSESKLSARALTGGRKSGIVAISPPNEFPRAVWEALVEEGKLRRSGSGLYELIDDTP
jgi:hypothetical protein